MKFRKAGPTSEILHRTDTRSSRRALRTLSVSYRRRCPGRHHRLQYALRKLLRAQSSGCAPRERDAEDGSDPTERSQLPCCRRALQAALRRVPWLAADAENGNCGGHVSEAAAVDGGERGKRR